MKRIYLYPITGRNNTGITNPYIYLLADSLSKNFKVVNLNYPSDQGIMDILKFLKKTDIVYLNWIEDLPEKFMGGLQSIFFFILFPYLKLRGKKIVWTLHNKKSHSTRHPFIKRIFFKLLLNHSDLILTHAEEGIHYIPEKTPKAFFPHPVKNKFSPSSSDSKIYDIIIWGTIAPYKGIDTFLLYLEENKIIQKYRILIAGKIVDSRLREVLSGLDHRNSNITLLDQFIDDAKLIELINKSNITLFTYHSNSVLSSGALMDSLLCDTIIAGPATGAFKDLQKEGLIYTFNNYKELIKIINQLKEAGHDKANLQSKIQNFIRENTWDSFSDKIYETLNRLYPENI